MVRLVTVGLHCQVDNSGVHFEVDFTIIRLYYEIDSNRAALLG